MGSCLGYMCVCSPGSIGRHFGLNQTSCSAPQGITVRMSILAQFILLSASATVCVCVCAAKRTFVYVSVCVYMCWLLFDFGWLPVGLNVAAFLVTWPFVGLTFCACECACVCVCVCVCVCLVCWLVCWFDAQKLSSAQLNSNSTLLPLNLANVKTALAANQSWQQVDVTGGGEEEGGWYQQIGLCALPPHLPPRSHSLDVMWRYGAYA